MCTQTQHFPSQHRERQARDTVNQESNIEAANLLHSQRSVLCTICSSVHLVSSRFDPFNVTCRSIGAWSFCYSPTLIPTIQRQPRILSSRPLWPMQWGGYLKTAAYRLLPHQCPFYRILLRALKDLLHTSRLRSTLFRYRTAYLRATVPYIRNPKCLLQICPTISL